MGRLGGCPSIAIRSINFEKERLRRSIGYLSIGLLLIDILQRRNARRSCELGDDGREAGFAPVVLLSCWVDLEDRHESSLWIAVMDVMERGGAVFDF